MKASTEPKTRRTIRKVMRRVGWHRPAHDNRITGRIYHLAMRRRPWWDWGNRLMILTGTATGGNYDSPSPETWWYRKTDPSRMIRTGYPQHPLSTFQIIKGDHKQFSTVYDSLSSDQQYEWKAICVNQDGDLKLGRRYWGEGFYGLDKWETAVLRQYLRVWRRRDWYGVRSWLYSQALHAAVYQRIPFTCQQSPLKGSGGYSHWLCQEKRRHSGPHRFNNYTWEATA